MNKTGIEWVKNPDGTQGYTWNPITGCLNHDNGLCKGGGFPCYAYKLANGRLKQRYLANTTLAPDAKGGVMTLSISGRVAAEKEGDYADPFYPRFWEERLKEPVRGYHHTDWYGHCEFGASPKGIFVCDMSDLFGIGIPEEWTSRVLKVIKLWDNRLDRFYLLTKQPQNLIKFSPFPENCWVGVTVTNEAMMQPAYEALDCVVAKVKYISFEPLLSPLSKENIKLIAGAEYYKWLDWLIIGACTGRSPNLLKLQQQYPSLSLMPYGHQWTAQPRIEWVREIVEAADKAGIPVFLKENLKPGLYSRALQHDPFWRIETNEEGIEILELRQELLE